MGCKVKKDWGIEVDKYTSRGKELQFLSEVLFNLRDLQTQNEKYPAILL